MCWTFLAVWISICWCRRFRRGGTGARSRTGNSCAVTTRKRDLWFVAAIPESSRAADVQGAKDALKPEEVWQAMREHNVHPKDRDKRRTKAFVRHGEWFFIPRPELRVAEDRVLCSTRPIRRGQRGKPHVCQFLHRIGGHWWLV